VQPGLWSQFRGLTCRVISSCSSCAKVLNASYFVPTKNGIAVCPNKVSSQLLPLSTFRRLARQTLVDRHTLLNPLACLYHSLIELRVDFRDKSNMNRIATASLHTSGSMLTNSR